jgi:hypothetical protein
VLGLQVCADAPGFSLCVLHLLPLAQWEAQTCHRSKCLINTWWWTAQQCESLFYHLSLSPTQSYLQFSVSSWTCILHLGLKKSNLKSQTTSLSVGHNHIQMLETTCPSTHGLHWRISQKRWHGFPCHSFPSPDLLPRQIKSRKPQLSPTPWVAHYSSAAPCVGSVPLSWDSPICCFSGHWSSLPWIWLCLYPHSQPAPWPVADTWAVIAFLCDLRDLFCWTLQALFWGDLGSILVWVQTVPFLFPSKKNPKTYLYFHGLVHFLLI